MLNILFSVPVLLKEHQTWYLGRIWFCLHLHRLVINPWNFNVADLRWCVLLFLFWLRVAGRVFLGLAAFGAQWNTYSIFKGNHRHIYLHATLARVTVKFASWLRMDGQIRIESVAHVLAWFHTSDVSTYGYTRCILGMLATWLGTHLSAGRWCWYHARRRAGWGSPVDGWVLNRHERRWNQGKPGDNTEGYGRIWKDDTLAVIIFHQYSFPKRPCFHMISQLANCLMVVMTCASRPTDYQEGPGHDITVIVSTSRKQDEPGRSLHIATVLHLVIIFSIDFHWLYEFRRCSKILRSHVKIDMALQVEVGSEIHDLLAGVPPQSSVTIVMDRLRYHVRHVRVLKLELKKKNMILILFNPIYIIYI
jgi:hypothetical protein